MNDETTQHCYGIEDADIAAPDYCDCGAPLHSAKPCECQQHEALNRPILTGDA